MVVPSVCGIEGFSCLVVVNEDAFQVCSAVLLSRGVILYLLMRTGEMMKTEKEGERRKGTRKENKRGTRRPGKTAQQLRAPAAFFIRPMFQSHKVVDNCL